MTFLRLTRWNWIAFLAALALLFWVPEAILYMGWAKFWITLVAEVFIWGLFAVAFNLLMGYTGMISFGQAAYLGIGGYTAGLLLKKVSGFPFALGLARADAVTRVEAQPLSSEKPVAAFARTRESSPRVLANAATTSPTPAGDSLVLAQEMADGGLWRGTALQNAFGPLERPTSTGRQPLPAAIDEILNHSNAGA